MSKQVMLLCESSKTCLNPCRLKQLISAEKLKVWDTFFYGLYKNDKPCYRVTWLNKNGDKAESYIKEVEVEGRKTVEDALQILQEALTEAGIKDYMTLSSNGSMYSLNLKNIDDASISYEDGVYHVISGSKEKYVLDGYATGDTISTGLTQEDPSDHTDQTSREFKGRMPGRFKAIEMHILDQALNEYEAALASDTSKGYDVLPYWAEKFNVKPSTVGVWMAKHRVVRKKKPLTFGELLKVAADISE